mgnify:CR=1 FL=1
MKKVKTKMGTKKEIMKESKKERKNFKTDTSSLEQKSYPSEEGMCSQRLITLTCLC